MGGFKNKNQFNLRFILRSAKQVVNKFAAALSYDMSC